MPKKPRSINAIGRKRRTLGWTLLTLGQLVAAVWVWSGGWHLDRVGSNSFLYVTKGVMMCGDNGPPGEVRWRVQRTGEPWQWWFLAWGNRDDAENGHNLGVAWYASSSTRSRHSLNLAFWPIPLVLWTPAVLLLRSGILARRRANTGMCAKCGYSLAGLAADATCPECGTVLSGVQRMKAGSEVVRSTGPLQPPDGSST